MAPVLKLFCFAISVLLFLQLVDADDPEKTPKDGTEPKSEDGEEHKAPLLKTLSRVASSRPARMIKQVVDVAGDQLKSATKKFESNLNDESKKQVNDDNSLIPNFIKNNVIQPGKAAAKTGIDILKEPVGKIVSNIKDTYQGELAKAEKEENYVPIIGSYTKIANKPVALLNASKDLVGNTLNSIFGKAKSFWSSSKKDSDNKSEKEDE